MKSDATAEAPATPATPRLRPLAGLWPFVRPYKGLMAGWLGFLALSSAATLSLPVAVRFMIDGGFGGQDAASIDRYFAALFGVALVLALATAARFYFVTLLGERVVADIRRALYTGLMRLDLGFYERTRTGEIISRLSADTELLRSVVGSSASVALRSVVTLLGSGVMLAVTSPWLAGLALVGIPLVILPIVVFGRRVRRLSRDSQDRIADANARAGETLNAMHTVQSYAREGFESERYGTAVDAALRAPGCAPDPGDADRIGHRAGVRCDHAGAVDWCQGRRGRGDECRRAGTVRPLRRDRSRFGRRTDGGME